LRPLATSLAKNRRITWELAKREHADRYAGQAFGVVWAIVHPLFLIGLYVFVFKFVFKQNFGGTDELPFDYTVYLLSGLVCWLSSQDALIRSCSAIVSKSDLVRQVVFPLEILPVKVVLSSLFTLAVSIAVIVGYVAITFGRIPLVYLMLPLLVALQALFLTGIGFVLAVTGVFMRDIKDFIQVFATAGVYLMPVVYLPNMVPPLFKPFLYLNPFSYLVWCFQDVLFFGRIEHPVAWVVCLVGGSMVLLWGYRLFDRLRPAFGSVI
jgi:lipopolysaccharide transport system permease protein